MSCECPWHSFMPLKELCIVLGVGRQCAAAVFMDTNVDGTTEAHCQLAFSAEAVKKSASMV